MHKYVGACVSGRSMGFSLMRSYPVDMGFSLDERVDFRNGGADLVL